MSRAWRLVLPAVLGGLLAGVWLGARCQRAADRKMRREGPTPERVVKMLRRELKLRDDQTATIRGILDTKRPAFQAIRREEQSSMAALRSDIDKAILPLLDETQRLKLGELRARWEKRDKEPGPPHAP